MNRTTIKSRLSKIGVVFLALLLVFGSVPFNFTGAGQVFAAPEDDGVYAEFTNIQYLDGNGDQITGGIAQNAATQILFDWHVVNAPTTSTSGAVTLEPLVYTFPSIVNLGANDDGGTLNSYGNYLIDVSARTLTLTFNDLAVNDINVHGTVTINRSFQVDQTTVTIPYEIQLQTTSGAATQLIYFIPEGGADITKAADDSKLNDDKEVTYTIDINTTSNNFGDKIVKVSDVVDTPLAIDNTTFQLQELQLNSDGAHTPIGLDLFDNNNLSSNTSNSFEYDLSTLFAGATPNHKAYRLTYKAKVDQSSITDLTPSDPIEIENTATLSVDGSAKTASETVNYTIKPMITKTGVADKTYNGEKIDWTVTLNASEFRLMNSSLNDVIPNGLVLDTNSIVVTDLTNNVQLTANNDYTNSSNASTLNLVFSNNITEKLQVTYTTTLDPNSLPAFTNDDHEESYTNQAEIKYLRPTNIHNYDTSNADATVKLTFGGLFNKAYNGKSIGYDKKKLKYKLIINSSQENLGKLYVKDALTGGNHFYDESSVVIYPTTIDPSTGDHVKGAALANSDFTVTFGNGATYPNPNNATGTPQEQYLANNPDDSVPNGQGAVDNRNYMMIEFNQNIDAGQSCIVEYETIIKRKSDGTFDTKYKNNAMLWWTDWGGNGNGGNRIWHNMPLDEELSIKPGITNSGDKYVWRYPAVPPEPNNSDKKSKWVSNGQGNARYFNYHADGSITQKWVLQARLKNERVKGLTFEDTLSQGFYLTSDQFNSIEVKKYTGQSFHGLTLGTDYTLSITSGSVNKVKSFKVEFPDDQVQDNARYNVYYESTVDSAEYPSANNLVAYSNTMKITATKVGETEETLVKDATVTPRLTELETFEGKKEAEWVDATKDQIKWSVYLNYLHKDLAQNYTVTDVINGNMALLNTTDIDSNFEFFTYDVHTAQNDEAGNGTITSTTTIPKPAGVSISYDAPTRQIILVFANGITERIGFRYKTKREGLSQYVYENTAVANGIELIAGIRFAPDNSGLYVAKSALGGVQYDAANDIKYIDYEVVVNENGNSTIDNLTITDTMPISMQIDDINNVSFVGADSGQNYSSVFDKTFTVDGSGATTYSFSYTGSSAISEQLNITYRVIINESELVNGSNALQNNVNFSGAYSQQGTTTETSTTTTTVVTSSGTGSGTARGTITIEKVDKYNTDFKIEGAQFQLEKNGWLYPVQTTDSNGIVTFNNMLPGVYTLREIAPANGYVLDSSTTTIDTTNHVNATEQVVNSPDLRIVISKTDEKNNSLDGATFALYEAPYAVGSQPVQTGVTGAAGTAGQLEFKNLENKAYVVIETVAPNGYQLDTTAHTVSFLDYDPTDANYQRIKTLSLKNKLKTYTLGDYVWEDSNADGMQDMTEDGVAGVTVTLKDVNGVVIGTTTTDSDGYYKFIGLTDGNYTVTFTVPAGYQEGKVGEGNGANDSDGKDVTNVVISGASRDDIDLGLVKKQAPPTYTLGDYVWEDSTDDGLQDRSESGVAGVTVTLTKPDGSTVTTTTDENGYYEFAGLTDGNYTVTFTVPASYQEGKVGKGNGANDSDGKDVTNIVISGANRDDIDLGLVKKQASTETTTEATTETTSGGSETTTTEPTTTAPTTEPTTVAPTTEPTTTVPTTADRTEPTIVPTTTERQFVAGDTPDPNDNESPDVIVVIDENGTPLGTYHKKPDSDGGFIYINDNGVPLGTTKVVKTGNDFPEAIFIMIAVLSLAGAFILKRATKRVA